MGRPVCANLVWAGYLVTAADVRAELDSMVAGWGCGGAAYLMRWRRKQKSRSPSCPAPRYCPMS